MIANLVTVQLMEFARVLVQPHKELDLITMDVSVTMEHNVCQLFAQQTLVQLTALLESLHFLMTVIALLIVNVLQVSAAQIMLVRVLAQRVKVLDPTLIAAIAKLQLIAFLEHAQAMLAHLTVLLLHLNTTVLAPAILNVTQVSVPNQLTNV